MYTTHLPALVHNKPYGLLPKTPVVHGGVGKPALRLLQLPLHRVRRLLDATALAVVHCVSHGAAQGRQLVADTARQGLALYGQQRSSRLLCSIAQLLVL